MTGRRNSVRNIILVFDNDISCEISDRNETAAWKTVGCLEMSDGSMGHTVGEWRRHTIPTTATI